LRDGSGGIRILPAGDPSGLHGKQFSVLGLDEVHTQRDWSVLEALQPDPTRRDCLVWITSYDSVNDEPGTPLHDLKQIGMANSDERLLFSWYSGDYCTDPAFASLDPEERANPSMLSWPEGRLYLDQQKARLPPNIYRRLHLNLPGTAESFIRLPTWDACVDPGWREVLHDRSLAVHVGVDAGLTSDPAAIVAVYNDRAAKQVRLAFHRIFVPPRGGELDLDGTIGDTLRMLKQRYRVTQILYDPWQMEALAQQLRRESIPMEKFPQTPANLTACAQNLLELINARNIVLYPDGDMRLSASRVIATEMPRGWKLDKSKQAHKIDVIVALSMACHSAVEGLSAPLHPSAELFRSVAQMSREGAAARSMGFGGGGETRYGERKWLQMQRRGNNSY
jgi:phage terminase large subunit-like protein